MEATQQYFPVYCESQDVEHKVAQTIDCQSVDEIPKCDQMTATKYCSTLCLMSLHRQKPQ